VHLFSPCFDGSASSSTEGVLSLNHERSSGKGMARCARSQVERLERFVNMAKLVQDELETRLASLEAELPDEDAEN
tara:strand:+ start:240 stop:467 length:228 start_codon:yes stop_codon:yes gene_type:complete